MLVTLQCRTTAQWAEWHRSLVSHSISWVYKKKREEMALLFLFLDLNSCPLLNQNEKFIFSPFFFFKKTNNMVSLKYFRMIILKHFILVSVFILKRTPKKQKVHYLNYEVGCFWQFQNSSNASTCWAERFVQFDPVLQTIAVTDASGKNNSLKKFPKPLMYITENRHWSLSYKNLASNLLLLFFRSFKFPQPLSLYKEWLCTSSSTLE